MKKRLATLAIQTATWLLIAPLLTGCLAADHPVSATRHSEPSVIGNWTAVEAPDGNNRPMELVITDDKDGLYEVVKTETSEGKPRSETYKVFLTRGPEHTYVNMLYQAPVENAKTNEKTFVTRYLIYLYELKGDQLKVVSMGYDELDAAIKSGNLHGKAWQTTWGSNAIITDESAALLAFLEKPAGQALFTNKLFFKRTK